MPTSFCPRSDMTRDDATSMTGSTHTCFMHQHARWWTPASSTARHQQNTFISTDLQVENYVLLALQPLSTTTHGSQVSTSNTRQSSLNHRHTAVKSQLSTPSSQVSTINTRQSSLKIQTSMELGARWQLVRPKEFHTCVKHFIQQVASQLCKGGNR